MRDVYAVLSQNSRNQDSSVDIAMGYGLDGPGSIPGSARLFSSQPPDRLRWVRAALSSVWEVKRQGHQANHSPSSNVEVKKSGAMPPLPHMSSYNCT
jgi:hypothetical protein